MRKIISSLSTENIAFLPSSAVLESTKNQCDDALNSQTKARKISED
jgi:hypothetical protein